MPATDVKQSRLKQWAAKQKQAAARYVSLHDTIFGVHKYQYFIYRTRYVFITVLLRTAVHIAELLLVVNIMPTGVQVLMFARLASTAVESGWWGLTESMRKRIRWLRKEGNLKAIQDEIEGWISLSVFVGLLIVAASVFIFGAVRHGNSLSISILAVVVTIQTGIRIISRTFYSGAYAIRRVFLPIEMIIIPELVITAAGFLLYEPLGEWAVILCMVTANVVGTLIHYVYVRDVSDFLRITPKRFFSVRAFARLFQNHSLPGMLLSGGASLCMRLQEIGLIATIQILARKNPGLDQILFPLYITMPLIRSAASWGQLTYFDLTKYGLDCIHEFRNRFERLCLEFSFLLSLVFCALASILIVMFSGDYAPRALLVILPHIIMSALLGFILVALFSRQKYMAVTLLCCLQYAIFLRLILLNLDVPLWLILVYASLAPLVLGWLALLPNWQAPESALRSFTKWVAFVRASSRPLVLLKFTLSHSCTGPLRRRLIKMLMAHIESGDLVTILPNQKILVSMPEAHAGDRVDKEKWLMIGGGHITEVALHRTGAGGEALNAFTGVAASVERLDEKNRLDELIAYFTQTFPEGVVQYPLQPEAAVIDHTSSEDRRIILHAAKAQLEGGKPPASERWHIDIGTVSGCIACIFLLPRQLPVDKIRHWRRHLLSY